MGELSKPIMSPLGIVYRSLCATEGDALSYSEWAARLFGGTASGLNVIGPTSKGFYEAAILATVPADVKCVKRPKGEWPTDWYATPTPAYVLFNDVEAPIALYFHEKSLIFKPKSEEPMIAFFVMDLKR